MKILRIRFKNLNSLEGEWEIDFTHPAYLANPIFAITGPTGSGKTTLLDAICLALYGRTPRLKTVSKSVNEIMTRLTGECFAEVTFETLKGKYRCHWSQHRARKKSLGDLQQPRHEIVDHEEKHVLENMIKKVAVKVEEVTGMTFDQFTRSILLAQGSFAAFLQASPDERAPLLEQLTGTEIYSRISQKVHEVTAQQEKSFALLNDELAGLPILSIEEQNRLSGDLADKNNIARQQGQKLDTLTQQISWLEKLASLNNEIHSLKDEYRAVQHVKRGQYEQRISLQRAKIASLYSSQHEFLVKMKQQQTEEISVIGTLQKEEQSLQENITTLEKQMNKAASSWQEAEENLEKEREIITVVRTLDVQIQEVENHQEQEEEKASQIEQHINKTQQLLSNLAEQRKAKESQLQESRIYLEEQHIDGSLAEKLPVLNEKIGQLQVMIERQQELEKQLAEIKEQSKNVSKEVKNAQHLFEKSSMDLLEREKNYSTVNQTGAEIRHHHPQLMQQLESTNEDLLQLDKLLLIRRESKQTNAEITMTHQQYQNFQNMLHEAERKEKEIQKSQIALNETVRQEEDIFMLAKRAKNYKEERAALQPGSPCPVCGSTSHPYRENDHDLPAVESLEDLAKAKKQLTALQEDLVEVQTDIKFYRRQLEEHQKSEKQLQKRLEKQEISLLELRDFFSATSPENFEKELLQEIEIKKHRKSELHKKYEELEKLDQDTAELRAQVDVIKEEKNVFQRSLEEKEHAQQQIDQKEIDLNQTSRNLTEEVHQKFTTLSKSLTTFALTTVKIDELDLALEKLQVRQDRWKQHKENESSLKEELQLVERDEHGQQFSLDSFEKELQLQRTATVKLNQKLDDLRVKRGELYDEKDPDAEEQRCKQQLMEASQGLEKLKEEFTGHERKIINLRAQLENLNLSTTKRAEQIQNEEETLTRNLQDQGFHDVETFKKAILPEQRIIELESVFTETDDNIVRLTTLLKEKQKNYSQEKSRQLTSVTLEQLKQTRQDQTEILQQTLQEIGRIQGRLEENQKLLDQQQKKREVLQTKKRELERWQKLDWLIGSASGKKFRNFAQGLTFDIMVDHANKNLQKMSDRYILVRDQLQPLELNIIDNYRGGDIRSTQNLSGGESFLVSLALALGLSSMAGDNVRVDSFFLDEGFGTLDEETLDTALHTLAGLQQEGKMIGIISHVSLLKERLDTQIKLIPKTGGHSKLNGPGIRAL